MCGICGIFILNRNQKVDNSILQRMTDSLTHRGPDDEGFFVSDFVGFGHRRLSIIDLAGGHQPIYNEDKSKCIIFNGEIYNFQEIRKFLLQKGHKFSTLSDTEVILHLYEQMGTSCVEKLRGMFAFAIYDQKEKSLFLARDRLGIKPLYYYYHDNKFIFGSEIKAILTSEKVDKSIDLEALSDYLTYLYILAPKSIFKYIKKLPAGHWLLINRQNLKIQKYWDLDFSRAQELAEKDWIGHLENILEDAIRMRLISEVPLGAFLSGGIDSSVVVALMSRIMKEPVITNSIGFNEKRFNELDFARETSRIFKTNHHEYTVNPYDTSVLDKLSWFYDEPFADSSALPTYFVSQMTKQNVTVALSGDGGDENFAGYRRYYFDIVENKIRSRIPDIFLQTVIAGLGKIYPKADWLPQILRAKTLLTNLSQTQDMAYFISVTHMTESTKKSLLNYDVYKSLNNYSSFQPFSIHYHATKTLDLLSRIQYTDIKTYLVDDILTKVDRASMANSLEVRVPLLDHIFMEMVAQIPFQLKLNGRISKYIFKEMAKNLVPEKILNRKKMGFSIPLDNWFKKELKNIFTDEILENSRCNVFEYFNKEPIHHIWGQHQKGFKNQGTLLWSLLMFEKWAQKFLSI